MTNRENSSRQADSVLFRHAYDRHHTWERRRRRLLGFRLVALSAGNLMRASGRQLAVFAHDFIGHHMNVDGVYEYYELRTLFDWLSACHPETFDGVAADVGANVGNHALFFSDYFHEVHSFEPNPRTFKLLALNAELATNVRCYEMGLSDADRVTHLRAPANNRGGARITSAASEDTVEVRLSTLDSALSTERPLRLLKIDVEGHEYPALLGAERTIGQHRPVILFEQLETDFEHGTSKVIELLREYGYSRFARVFEQTRRLRADGKLTNIACRVLNRVVVGKSYLFGTEWKVEVTSKFTRQRYPFIVALPDWLS